MLAREPEPEYMDLEEEAKVYAEAGFEDVNEAYVDRICELADAWVSPLAVDLGTGPGDIPIRIARRRPGWRIAGFDASRAMLRRGQARVRESQTPPRVGFVRADAKRIPLADGSADILFSNSILHHVESAHAFWREVKRVARPGALTFHRDLTRPDSREIAHALVEEHSGNEPPLLREEFYRSLLAAYTPGEVRAQLEHAGLDGLTVEQVTDRHLDVYGAIGQGEPK